MIRAEVHSDDMIFAVRFDAEAWFLQARDDEIVDLGKSGWGGDCPADAVAKFYADGHKSVSSVFEHVSKIQDRGYDVGFECRVHHTDAIAYVRLHRPHLSGQVCGDGLNPSAVGDCGDELEWDASPSWSGDYDDPALQINHAIGADRFWSLVAMGGCGGGSMLKTLHGGSPLDSDWPAITHTGLVCPPPRSYRDDASH